MCHLSLQSAALVWPLRLAPEISEQSKWNPVIVTHYPATDGHYTHVMGVIVPVQCTVHHYRWPPTPPVTWSLDWPSTRVTRGLPEKLKSGENWKLKSGPGPEKLVRAKNFGLDAESLISSLTKHKTCSHSHWQLVVVGLSRRNRCFGHSIKFQSDYTSRGLRGGSNFHKSYHRHLDRPLHTHITSWRYNFPLRCI